MRSLTAALTALALTLAAGCGGEAKDAVDGASLADAASGMKDQNVRMAMDMTVEGDEGFTMKGTGTSAPDNSKGRLKVTYKQGSEPATPMEIIMAGNDAWVSSPDFKSVLPKGKRWLHTVQESTPQSMSPAEFVEFIRGADDVKKAGEEEIRGQTTTRYSGNVGAEELGKATSPEAAAYLKRKLGGKDMKFPMQVWVGEDDLPARMTMDIADALSMRIDILEYGVDLNADPPPKAQVVDEKELEAG